MEKFKIKELVAATYRMDNSADENRKYAIEASVKVEYGKVQSIEDGKVTELEGEAPQQLADFNGRGSLTCTIYNNAGKSSERMEVFMAISDFCEGLREKEMFNV